MNIRAQPAGLPRASDVHPRLRLLASSDTTIAERDALAAAAAWLTSRYPELMPDKTIEVVLTPFKADNSGLTAPVTGNITIKPSTSIAHLASTLGHELMHARTSTAGRMSANLEAALGSTSDEKVLHLADQALWTHCDQEQRAKRRLSRDEAFEGNRAAGKLVFNAENGPEVHNQEVRAGALVDVIHRFPLHSAIRAAFVEKQ